MDARRDWVFKTTVHGGYYPDVTEWIFHGTEDEARQKLQELINSTWSPFVTYSFKERDVQPTDGGTP